ncbi:MAG: NF038122 family metalloprotease, partial [Polymorphobacter sp.]
MAQSVGHEHGLGCGHQWSDNQGTLSVNSSSPVVKELSLNNSNLTDGMSFILNDLGGVGVGTQARAGFEAAAAMWTRVLKDPISIKLDVRFSTLGPGILGSTGSTTNTIAYNSLKGLLAADSKTVWDRAAGASLQGGSALSFVTNEPPTPGTAIDSAQRFLDADGSFDNLNNNINTAQVKALGLNPVY